METSKCSSSCQNINNQYAKLCVPDIVKNVNIKVVNLLSRSNETRHIKRHETCKCKCRLDSSVCNKKQPWHEDKCRCKCKELMEKRVFDKGFTWNPSNCECECNKSCDIGEYLDYLNCKCSEKLIHKLVEEYTENIEETKLVESFAKNEHKCSSCKLYIVIFWKFFIFFLTIIGVGIYFTYYKYVNRNKANVPRYGYSCKTTIY